MPTADASAYETDAPSYVQGATTPPLLEMTNRVDPIGPMVRELNLAEICTAEPIQHHSDGDRS